jgi:hypothetical protein
VAAAVTEEPAKHRSKKSKSKRATQ